MSEPVGEPFRDLLNYFVRDTVQRGGNETMITTSPDSASIVAVLREQLVKLGLLASFEARNGPTARAIEQCVLIKKEDLRALIFPNTVPEETLNTIRKQYFILI